MSETLEIILKAVDDARPVFESVKGSVDDIANKVGGMTDSINADFQAMETNVSGFRDAVANIDSSSIDQLASELGMSTEEVERLIQTGAQIGSIPFNEASAEATELEQSVSDTDSKVDKLNNSLNETGNKGSSAFGRLKSAVSGVKSHLENLGQAFDGIGGMITQSLGVIGVNSIKEMTLEASISRDRIFNLSYALMGAGQSAEQFKSDANSLWNIMDAGTNNSLVGLDQLSQAMSVIKLSTGATTEQLKAIEPTILDIGQRAILMGKDGNEAIGLMEAAGKGLNGEFEMLKENLGISKDKLIDAGWSGAADDIDGYTQALSKCLSQSGDVSDMMDTTYGKLTSLQKFWKLAGRSLGDDFLPYIDMALDKFMAFADADSDGALDKGAKELMKYAVGAGAVVSAFASLAPTITPMFATLRELQSLLKGTAVFFGIMQGEENALTLATIRETAAQKISAATKWLSTAATSAYAVIVGVLHGEITLAAAAQAVWNAIMSANPIMLVVIALAALVIAIYEVGKAFGWWDNVGEMLNAVWAGIQRLWAAFINHPDVQATIQALSEAWDVLSAAIGGVINWIMSFFEVSSGSGEFDVVRALIEAIGLAWEQLTLPIRAVIAVVQFLIGAFKNVGSSQIDIVAALTNAWTFIKTFIGNTLLQISMAIVNWGINLFTSAVTAGQQFVTGVITYVRTLPTKMLVLLLLAYTHVRNQFTKMVTTAKNKITSLVTGVINKLTSLPGKAYNQLKRVVTSVANAGGEWVSKAREKAGDVVSGVKNVLSGTASSVSSALSGVVNAITAPFKKGYEEAKKWWNKAKNLGGAAGGDPLDEAYGGDPLDLLTGQPFNISTGGYTIVESETTLNVNETLTLDLQNVPNSVNEAELMVWLKSAVGDKGLIRTLVENKDFQALDSKMKESLAKKSARRM